MARITPQRLRSLIQESQEVKNEEVLVATVAVMEEERRRKERKWCLKPWIQLRLFLDITIISAGALEGEQRGLQELLVHGT